MKRILLIVLAFFVAGLPLLSQQIDSSAILEEMRQLKRASDSLYRAELAKDTAFGESLEESMRNNREAEPEETSRPPSEWEKKEKTRKRILNISLAGILGFFVISALLLNRPTRRQK